MSIFGRAFPIQRPQIKSRNLSLYPPPGLLAANQTIPAFAQTATAQVRHGFHAVQQVPDFAQTATLKALVKISASQTIPPFLEVGQFETAGVRANQIIPAFGQFALLANAPQHLFASQTMLPFGQVFTATQGHYLAAAQTIPAFGQIATLIGQATATIARLPDNVMKGARGGPTFSTARLKGVSGLEQRTINFEQSVNQYVIGYGVNVSTWPLVLDLYYAQLGGAHGFAARAPEDHSIANQSIGTGNGTATDFQIVQVKATAVRKYTRIITQPRPETLVVTVAGTPTTAFVLLPGGVIRFNSAPANGAAVAVTTDFDLLVSFSDPHLELQLQLAAVGQIPALNIKEIPPTTTGIAVSSVISAPSGNVDSTRLPPNVEKAARAGPAFTTTRLVSTSGKRAEVGNYPQSVNSYVIGYTADKATWPQIRDLFYCQLGGAYGFTFKDPADNFVSNQLIGIGDGATRSFQLVRLYDDGPRRYGRYVTIPDPSTLAVTLNAVPTSAYLLQANGIVLFNTAPANGVVIAASFGFFIPVGFADDHLDVTVQPGTAAPDSVAQIVTINLEEILPSSP